MISRRQLRIKVLQTLYAYYQGGMESVQKSENELRKNIEKAYELYHFLLVLIIDIVLYAESRIELAKNKRVPSYEDLHPNTRFIDNRLVDLLRNNDRLLKMVEGKKLYWTGYPELIKELYRNITDSDFFQEYMSGDEPAFTEDKKIISRIYTDIIFPNESVSQVLEERSIFWNDDFEFIISMIVKTIKKFKEAGGYNQKLMELYKNDDDRIFAVDLFRKSLVHREEYLEYIKTNTKNWDLERIAFLDILIMQMAITELLNFSSIPTKVTLNEYLDIAKFYSTQKSNIFINGVLDKVLEQLRNENKLKKSGRGLIGENE
ncbi:MAG: transcription antitermination protein NusB [Bacteroidales bacterium]|nr:transcription antitermination protein NusB [Bacteroidales bacterium]MBN2698469.1 transcription antitermination protein NusB [Bacteroidales bacterium]